MTTKETKETKVTIDFVVPDPHGDDPEYVSPYITIANPSGDLAKLKDPDEIVIAEEKIKIKFSYPLSDTVVFEEKAPNGVAGFTRYHLAKAICDRYRQIYDEEEASSAVPAANIPGMLNRCQTDGKYGIWGHSIEDLLLVDVTFDKKTKTCSLGVDS